MSNSFAGQVTLFTSRDGFEGPETRPVRFRLQLQADGRTLRVESFEPVVVDIESSTPKLRLTVTMLGNGGGRLDPATGIVELQARFHFSFDKAIIAPPSTLDLQLSTGAAQMPAGDTQTGQPVTPGDPVLHLVGSGSFQHGVLSQHRCGAIIDGQLDPPLMLPA
jgi:hypothetical protein